MRVVGTKSTKDHLCDYCQLEIPTCPKATHIKFGDGLGNDNVIECSEFVTRRWHNNYPIKGMPELGVFKKWDGNKPKKETK